MEKSCYTCRYNPELCPRTYEECSGKKYALWKPRDEVEKSVCNHPHFKNMECPFDNKNCDGCAYSIKQTIL